MISLHKSAEPQILIDNKQRWTQELLTGNDDALIRRKYAHPDIKSALSRETHGKCAYCESKVLHVTYGDVEHIVPKKYDKALTFEWSNLTLACDICNTKKGARTDIFDPYQTDPVDHFWFYGGLIFTTSGVKPEAEITLVILDLNRTSLVERRAERIKTLERHLKVIINCSDPTLRDVLIEALVNKETDRSTEFSACAQAFVDNLVSAGII